MSRRGWAWVAGSVLVIAILILAISELKKWSDSEAQKPAANDSGVPYVKTQVSGSGLVARMWVSPSRIYNQQPARLDAVFENHGVEALKGLQFISLQLPGFEPSGSCWSNGYPACRADPSTPRSELLKYPLSLPAGEAVHVWAEIRPAMSGRYSILAVYTFSSQGAVTKSGASASPDQSFTPVLKSIEITTPLREWLSFLNKTVLTVPLLTALLLWALGIWDKNRDKRRQQAEKEAAERHENAQEERQRIFTVWTEELKRVFEYTQQHYLPIHQSISNLKINVHRMRGSETQPGDPRYALQTLFSFLIFRIQMRQFASSKGGFFLSSSRAEEVLSKLSVLLKYLLTEYGPPEERMEAAVSAVEKPIDLAKFVEILVSPQGDVITDIWTPLLAWVLGLTPLTAREGSFDSFLALLTMMQIVLEFEWDRPFYRYWYATCPEFHSSGFRDALSKIPDTEGQWKAFRELAAAYTNEVSDYLATIGRL